MSKADALQAIIRAAWGDEDPAGGAHLVSEWLIKERLVDYSALSKGELREKAEVLRIAADLLDIGYMAMCKAVIGAPRAVTGSNARNIRKGKLTKDPKTMADAAAKAAAIELWPTANRKGWSATQLQRALGDAGHPMPYDTVRKWLTKLRRAGVC